MLYQKMREVAVDQGLHALSKMREVAVDKGLHALSKNEGSGS